ncbi:MAG: transposase [Actinobacteria bacterium]|nr:transposase [Actinomycetota bacterium]
MRAFSHKHKRRGYRKAWAILRDEGWGANRKKIQRLWREKGLRVPPRARKRQRLGISTCPANRLHAERPDHVWALDFQFDQTAGGKILKVLNIVDEHPGGARARRRSTHRCRPDRRALDDIATRRGAKPSFIRCDTGRSSPPMHSGAGAASLAPARATSNRARQGFVLMR